MSREQDLTEPGPVGRKASMIYWASVIGAVPGSALEAYKRAHGRYFLPDWREVLDAYGPFEPVMAELLDSLAANRDAIKAKLPRYQSDESIEVLRAMRAIRLAHGRPLDGLDELIAQREHERRLATSSGSLPSSSASSKG